MHSTYNNESTDQLLNRLPMIKSTEKRSNNCTHGLETTKFPKLAIHTE